ncbi:MAG: hypothetical protein U0Q55_16830 [Vicinamibacterales bacterium]
MRRLIRSAAMATALVLLAGAASAQGRLPRRNGPLAQEGVSPGEVQRLFDAYVVMQAQQELQLSDEQYPRFLARVRVLQAARQKGLADRARILQDLRRLESAASLDDAQARTQLRALEEIDARTANEVRDAMNGIDEVLDTRQRIRFRVFEEQMERRKVELLMRARQSNRARNP